MIKQKLFWCQQSGYDYQWISGETNVVRWLCDLFGLSFQECGLKLWEQIEAIPLRGTTQNKDLSIVIERFE